MKRYIKSAVNPDFNFGDFDYSEILDIAETTRDQGILAELAAGDNAFLRGQVAQNPHTPEPLRDSLANDEDRFVRAWVAVSTKNPNIVLKLSYGPDPLVRQIIAGRYKLPKDILSRLLEDEDPEVREAAESTLYKWEHTWV